MSNAAKIMVVDDSPAIVDSIEMMLDFEGFEVAKFYKGSEMFSALDPHMKPDVILMDMWLSGEDGRDFASLSKLMNIFRTFPYSSCRQAADWNSLRWMQVQMNLLPNLSIWEIWWKESGIT